MNTSKKSILILDDEPFVRDSLVDYFEDCLWTVFCSGLEDEALDIIKNNKIDCAIVDIRMAGIGGDQFIREANKLSDKIGFVVCTGSPEYEIPSDLTALSNVSKIIFSKPVTELDKLEQELLTLTG